MKKCASVKGFLFLLLSLSAGILSAQNWQLVTPAFEQTETIVAGYVVDPGSFSNPNDVSAEVQTLLNNLNNCGGDNDDQGHGGGVLYFRSGHYKFRGPVNVPKGVTIRGDWQQPVKGQPLDKGTVFEVYWGANKTGQDDSFLKLHSGASVHGITFWYPEQTHYADPTPYSHTILLGKGYGWSAEFNFVRNVTFVNAYSGIYYQDEGGTCPNINGVYGTPLVRGVEIDNIVDVGRLDKLDFSPEYWIGSGFAGAPTAGNATAFKNWLYNNGVGVIMRRNDWSYTCYLSVEGYNKGFYATECKRNNDSATPNGHNYGLVFNGCKYGLYHDGRMGEGIMFTQVTVNHCEYGCYVSGLSSGTLQLIGWEFNNQAADQYDLYVDPESGTKVHLQQSVIHNGRLVVNGGALAAVANQFDNPAPQVELNKNSRGVLVGNSWKYTRRISERNAFENTVDDTPLNLKPLPAYLSFTERNTQPAGTAFEWCQPYGGQVVTRNTVGTATDATAAINASLQRVAGQGGGVVYLAPGHYRIDGQILIPSGVELKGSTDVGTFPLGPGSYLDVYNRSNAAVLMKAGSGLRGVHFDYPEQVRCTVIPDQVIDYPFTIQGDGDNLYIVNVGTRCSNRWVNLTGCNQFYINYLTGYFFREGVNVKHSSHGIIANMQCNTQVYNNGYETKYGQFPNSFSENCPASTDPYNYNSKNLNFLTMEDVSDIFLYNDFNYNTLNGIIFKDNVSGKALGFALDDDRTGLYLDGDNIRFDFINLQCVALERDGATPKPSSYITATSRFGANSEVSLYGSDYWGNCTLAAVMMEAGAAGTINLYESNFAQINSGNAFKVNGGTLNVINSTVVSPSGDMVRQTGNGQVNIVGSFASVKGNPTVNLHNALSATANSQTAIDRSGWSARASYSNGGDNVSSAQRAIDGNPATDWTCGWQNQGVGQGEVWFEVDMGRRTALNEIILEYSDSPNDGPQQYILQVSDDGAHWTEASTGTGAYMMTIIAFETQEVRYFRILKPASTKSNFWKIQELYAFNMQEDWETEVHTPYNGPHTIYDGAVLEAEDFDNGGEGLAYHDQEAGHQNGQAIVYRPDVDVEIESYSAGDYNIGFTSAGEWLMYTIEVAQSGVYTIQASCASGNAGGRFYYELDGIQAGAVTTITETGSWSAWKDFPTTGIALTEGTHHLKWYTYGNLNLNKFRFERTGNLSAMDEQPADGIALEVLGHHVRIRGLHAGDVIEVFSLTGMLEAQRRTMGEDAVFLLPEGLHLVVVNHQVAGKVLIAK